MHSSLLLLLVFFTIVSSLIDSHLHYYDEVVDDEYDDSYLLLLLENNEVMRNLASSTVRLPINTDEIRGLQYLYNATNGDNWEWNNNDTNTYGIPWNFTVSDLSLVHPCYDHWQGILCSCNTSYYLSTEVVVGDDDNGNDDDDDGSSYDDNDDGSSSDDDDKNDMKSYYYDDIQSYYTSTNNYSCHITKIYLPRFNLSGTLPGEMFLLLPNLTHLHIEHNSLSSPLPPEMNQSSLLLLNIRSNNFKESLDVIGSITSLQVLIAYGNYNEKNNIFTGNISPLKHLKSLNYINLGSNNLTGDLSGIAGLVGLKRLSLINNNFVGTIDGIRDLTNLRYLDLSFNKFSGSIEAVSNLTNLNYLNLRYNHFTDSIEAVSNLTYLEEIEFSSNSFTGSIEPLANLIQLKYLYLSTNNFTGSVNVLSKLTNMLDMELSENKFTGSIEALRNMTMLNLLIMFSNQFTGSIEALSNMTNLFELNLEHNDFTGSIEALSNMTHLTSLTLTSNNFIGSIDSVANLVNLEFLYIHSNKFTGSIDAIRNLTNILILWFSSNHFTGTIDVLGSSSFTKLKICLLDNNYLSGSIEAVSNLPNIRYLILDHNLLTGSIEAVTNVTTLICLRLSSNYFTGPITPLSKLTTLYDLELYENEFTGSIDALANMSYLEIVYLSNNSLTGSLQSLANLDSLELCIIDHNAFTGSIPSLYNASELSIFIAGNNLLTGTLLPDGFPSSTEIIDVANNILTGELPMELFSLPELQIFSAGINCMTARFTDEVCNAHLMDTLLLDGLHSAISCRIIVPMRFFDTIYASSQSVSSLPSCIYSLPSIIKLHLSGNGITGSLPVDAILNAGFIELVLSNNEYKSVIPDAFQNHRWDIFDVSYNKFSGTLLSSLDISSSARFKINRISGDIPSSLYNTSDVAALTGNIFTCTNEELVKLQDEVQDRYVCGSSSFTNAGLLWFTVVMVVVTIISLSYTSYSGQRSTVVERWIANVLLELHDLRTRFLSSSDLTRVTSAISNELKVSISEIEQFNSLGQTVRLATGLVTAVFVCVNLPLYCIFSSYFGSYSITYAWTASAAYLSGIAPGVILLLLYLCIIVVPCHYYRSYLQRVLLHHHNDDNNSAPSSVGTNDDLRPRRERNISMISVLTLARKRSVTDIINKETIEMVQKRFISMCLISAVNLVVVGTLNFTYVLVTLRYNGTLVTLVDIAMGVFKAVWTNVVIVEAIRLFDVHYIKSGSKAEGQRLSFLSFTSILNNIIIPCVALSLANPDCFYNLIYSRDDVSSSYNVNDSIYFAKYFTPIRFESQLRFTPSYAYSYQCSSAILTSYTVIFLYSALFGLISQPIRDCVSENLATVQDKLVTQLLSFLITTTSGSSNKRNSSSSNKMASIAPLPLDQVSSDEVPRPLQDAATINLSRYADTYSLLDQAKL